MANPGAEPEPGHGPVPNRIVLVRVDQVRPSPENDLLYQPVQRSAADFKQLVQSVRADGVKEPLVLTLDSYILSGHRRHAAARSAGLLEVPARYENVRRGDGGEAFVKELAKYNQQRSKTLEEQSREALVLSEDVKPEDAHRELLAYRRAKAESICPDESLEIVASERKARCEITRAKTPFIVAIRSILARLRDFWPLTARQIHYQLLNDPPLKHASKRTSVYANDSASYKALLDLLTRARLQDVIPIDAIGDDTRPQTCWRAYKGVGPFVREQVDKLFACYAYDLQADQPAHLEVVAEKLTVQSILRPVAEEYVVPLTISRGFGSIPPRRDIVRRFKRSGKDDLVIIAVRDADPDGEGIASSLATSLMDDFGLGSVTVMKAALRPAQAVELGLPPAGEAKTTSSRHDAYVGEHGTSSVWELEALSPEVLQRLLCEAINSVLDVDLFNAAVEQEKQHAAHIAKLKAHAKRVLTFAIDGPNT